MIFTLSTIQGPNISIKMIFTLSTIQGPNISIKMIFTLYFYEVDYTHKPEAMKGGNYTQIIVLLGLELE